MLGGGNVDGIPPERTFVVTVLQGRELIVEEHTVSRNKAVTRILDDVSWWVGGLRASVTEAIPLRDETPGMFWFSWKFWRITWQSDRAKGKMGLDMLNNK